MLPISIVLIDGHAAFSANVEYFLRTQPQLAVVATALDGEMGLCQAERLHPDMTLIDLELVGFTGLEVIRRLRASLPAMGIIALSLGDQDPYRQAALGAGADAFVSKTRLIEELPAVIQQVGQARQML